MLGKVLLAAIVCTLKQLWTHTKVGALCAAGGFALSLLVDKIILFDAHRVIAGKETISRFLKNQAEAAPLWPLAWTAVLLLPGLLLGHLYLVYSRLEANDQLGRWDPFPAAVFGALAWLTVGMLLGGWWFAQK